MSNAMPTGARPMEGGGAYNKYAKLPAGGAALALGLLEKAAKAVAIEASDRPIVIADYGSSQGKNSQVPIQIAIQNLRSRIGESRPILVFHIDQPSNDFNSLFNVLASDPDRYCLEQPHIFPCAIGRSFYERVLPRGSVHLGWSSYAAVWLSRIPRPIPGHFIALGSSGAVRAEFERQAAKDWEQFLSLRAGELSPGGRLVVVLPGIADHGLSGVETIMNQANDVLREMVEEGSLTAEERSRMVIGSYPRRKSELLAPFAAEGQFHGLQVESVEESVLPDSSWTEYTRYGDRAALAAKHALFFRSVFMPSMAAALDGVRGGDANALQGFGEKLERGLRKRIADHPVAMHSFVHTIVLSKR